MKKSPMEHTRAWLKEQGYLYDTVERFIQTGDGGFRRDMFKFGDIVALAPLPAIGVLAIQVCSVKDRLEHIRKILHTADINEAATAWLERKNRLEVWGWRKLSKKGEDGKLWQARKTEFMLDEFGSLTIKEL